MGPPGSGKGTQAKLLSDIYKIPHISSGDIFRKAMGSNDDLGNKLQAILRCGRLVPDSLTNEIVFSRLLQEDCKNGFILDGYPRTITQGDDLGEFFEKHQIKNIKVINLDVDREIIIDRLCNRILCKSCGASYNLKSNPPEKDGVCDRCGSKLSIRDDDNEDTVIERMDVYEESTKPLIEYYQNKNLLCNIKGNVSVKQATKDICACIEEFEIDHD